MKNMEFTTIELRVLRAQNDSEINRIKEKLERIDIINDVGLDYGYVDKKYLQVLKEIRMKLDVLSLESSISTTGA
jgi:hypothetical protein